MSNSKVITRSTDVKPADPLTLTFQDHEGKSETFTFVGEIPGIRLLDFMAHMEAEANTGAPKAIRDLINQSLWDDAERERWNEFANDFKNLITIEVLTEMVTWLAEKYTNVQSPQPTNPTPAPAVAPSAAGAAGATEAPSALSAQSAAG